MRRHEATTQEMREQEVIREEYFMLGPRLVLESSILSFLSYLDIGVTVVCSITISSSAHTIHFIALYYRIECVSVNIRKILFETLIVWPACH